jgi:hypothetical protein
MSTLEGIELDSLDPDGRATLVCINQGGGWYTRVPLPCLMRRGCLERFLWREHGARLPGRIRARWHEWLREAVAEAARRELAEPRVLH